MVNITAFEIKVVHRFLEMVPHMSGIKSHRSTIPLGTRHKGCLDEGQTASAQTSQVYILRSACLDLRAVWSKRKILFLGPATMLTRNMLIQSQRCRNDVFEKTQLLQKNTKVGDRGSGRKADLPRFLSKGCELDLFFSCIQRRTPHKD